MHSKVSRGPTRECTWNTTLARIICCESCELPCDDSVLMSANRGKGATCGEKNKTHPSESYEACPQDSSSGCCSCAT